MEKGHEIRYCTWNIRSLYWAGSLTAVARELARCQLDLMGVQVRWGRGVAVREDYNFFYGKKEHQVNLELSRWTDSQTD